MLLCIINFFFKPINMLRGTLTKKDRSVWNQRPTLQGQINALRAQVNKTKPETQYFRVYGTHSASTTNPETVHHDVTQTLISASNFRDLINGDQWRNLFLKFRVSANSNAKVFRVLLYVPKDPSVTFSPTANQFTLIPDPSSYWIIYDKTFTRADINSFTHMQCTVSLKGLKTIYDSNAAVIRKGDVMATVISTSGTPSAVSYDWSYELGFNNL